MGEGYCLLFFYLYHNIILSDKKKFVSLHLEKSTKTW